MKRKSLSRVHLCVTPWTEAHQAPPSMGFSRQGHWSGLPCSPPGAFPTQGLIPCLLCLLHCRGFFTIGPLEKPKLASSKIFMLHCLGVPTETQIKALVEVYALTSLWPESGASPWPSGACPARPVPCNGANFSTLTLSHCYRLSLRYHSSIRLVR